jgi:DNA-binding SARP family transcriptional activator
MGILQITLFGGVHITYNNWQTEVMLTRESQALLAYLLLHRHRLHSRDVLAGVFWGEQSQEKARGSLNTALWKLKKALEPEGIPSGTYLKNCCPGDIGFNQSSKYWLDIEVFEREVNQTLSCNFQTVEYPQASSLDSTLELYQGELLEGFYDNWVLWERERLRTLYLKGLIYLLQYYRFHAKYENAIAYGQKILNLDPIREEIHRELMWLYLQNGERALALRQYEICRSTLAENYDISPMEETQALYMQIIRESDRSRLPTSQEQTNVNQALQQLEDASQAIDLVKEQIQQALLLITKYSESPEQIFSSKANGKR